MTIGGYDLQDFTGNMTWYDSSQCSNCWNITGTALGINDTVLNDISEAQPVKGQNFTISLQTGFPYIGLNARSMGKLMAVVSYEWNPDFASKLYCYTQGNSQLCYWPGMNCTQLTFNGNFVVQIGDLYYAIPIQRLVSTNWNPTSLRFDCDLYIMQIEENVDNAVRLGDAFFSAFFPVFDIENDLVGLALNSQALEGSSITQVVTPTPPQPPALLEHEASPDHEKTEDPIILQ